MAESGYLEAHSAVNKIITALENITDPLEIDGLVLRLDYLKHTNLTTKGNPSSLHNILRLILQEKLIPVFWKKKTTSKHMAQPWELKWQ